MAKFKVGQLVRVIGLRVHVSLNGALGEIISIPGTEYSTYKGETRRKPVNLYSLVLPGDRGAFNEKNLAPIDDTDHRTKADEDELIFKPKKEFNH